MCGTSDVSTPGRVVPLEFFNLRWGGSVDLEIEWFSWCFFWNMGLVVSTGHPERLLGAGGGGGC